MFALDSLVRNAVQQSVNVLHPENAPAPLDSAIHLEPYPFEVLKPYFFRYRCNKNEKGFGFISPLTPDRDMVKKFDTIAKKYIKFTSFLWAFTWWYLKLESLGAL